MGLNCVDPHVLSRALQDYMKQHPSARLVASRNTAFESWFRVELAAVLLRMGYKDGDLQFKYDYPPNELKSNASADLALGRGGQPIVFELKSFVSGDDANKKANFPLQSAQICYCCNEMNHLV